MRRSKKIFGSLKNSIEKAALVRRITDLENEMREMREFLASPVTRKRVPEKTFFSFPEKGLDIRITKCASQDSLYFHTTRGLGISQKLVVGQRIGKVVEAHDATEKELGYIKPILNIDYISAVFLHPFSFMISKSGAAKWEVLIPKILGVLPTLFEEEPVTA